MLMTVETMKEQMKRMCRRGLQAVQVRVREQGQRVLRWPLPLSLLLHLPAFQLRRLALRLRPQLRARLH